MKNHCCLLLCILVSAPVVAQTIREPNWDPDTMRVLYLDDCCPKPFPPSAQFPYQGATVRTSADAAGNYEDQMCDAESLRLLFSVKHQMAAGHAELIMYYPSGKPRLRAHLLEDTVLAPPVVYFVPSLRRPLSAYAKIDGELKTFYENGALRQQADYRQGRRVYSQCYDFRGRPVTCNANLPVVPPRLPAAALSGASFSLTIKTDSSLPGQKPTILACEATFTKAESGEPQVLLIRLPRQGISAESAELAARGGRYPIFFGLAATAQGARGTGSLSGALNQELRFSAMEAGRLFYYNPAQPLAPVRIDGEPVATYFSLPVTFGLLK